MDNKTFIAHCKDELRKVYINTKNGCSDEQQKYRTEGLFQAARLMKIVNLDEISKIYESLHQEVFGESIESRKKRKSELSKLKENSPDEYFEMPAIVRKR